MKGITLHISYLALLLTAALGLASCNDAWENVRQDDAEQYGTSLKVTLRVTGDRSTRATRAKGDDPAGGEDGDGREQGNGNESLVTNATLLLYRDADGINSTDSPLIEYALYAPIMNKEDKGDGHIYYTSDVLHYKEPLPHAVFHLIVLANMGDRTDLKGRTLDEVRDMTLGNPFTVRRDAKGQPLDTRDAEGRLAIDARDFAMTSARDTRFMAGVTANKLPENIIHVEAEVERLAARIDFSPGPLAATLPEAGGSATWVEGESVTVEEQGATRTEELNGYKYVVTDAATNTPLKDRFILTGVTPFNCLSSGTRYIKCVVNNLQGGGTKLVYLGDETVDASGNATNYVPDPWTMSKNTTTDPAGLEYRNRLTNANEVIDENLRWPVKGEKEMLEQQTSYDRNLKYYTLDYTQENTLLPGYGKERYATGLLISGYYGIADEEGNIEKYVPQVYHYYIRHADPNGSVNEALPMKYGIVRNNIYRIHIQGVNPLGQIQIVVNDWTRVDVPEIQI